MNGITTSCRTGRPAVFLDRDGTLVRNVEYLADPRGLRLLPGAADAVRRLNEAGFAVVVLTNQSGVARGILDEATLERIHLRLLERVARRGAVIDGIYYCPHHPDFGEGAYRRDCDCRKPAKGMLHRAVRDLGIRVEGSFVVGDGACDVGLAEGTPLRSVRLTRHGRPPADATPADHVAPTLAAAVDWILAGPRSPSTESTGSAAGPAGA
jgi:D-glycero-D-manno-heptose 1,7-bisphosphate phosphatase